MSAELDEAGLIQMDHLAGVPAGASLEEIAQLIEAQVKTSVR